MKKRFFRSERAASALGGLVTRYIKFVFQTGRLRSDPADAHAKLMAAHPCIATVWHGQGFMALPTRPPSMKVKVLVTRHGDGQFAGHALSGLGAELIHGAGAAGRKRKRDKGGAQALRAMVKALADGYTVIITADMPGSPPRQAGLGVVTLARISGRPVVPIGLATSNSIALNTWSKFVINLPFSKIGFAVGDPIDVPRQATAADMETARRAVEDGLNAACIKAFELTGANTVKAIQAVSVLKPKPGFSLQTYIAITRAMQPASGFILRRRVRRGKEIAERLGEREGHPSAPRPEGTLWWFHAASVGETNAILPIIHDLHKSRPKLNILLTTVTVTSAQIAEARLPPGAVHQFLPLDSPAFVRRFLDAWHPDLALFTESEIWPNLILEVDRRGVPLLLLNARMSDRSFARWKRLTGMSHPLFSRFDLIMAQNKRLARRLEKLGAPRVIFTGNIKFDAPPPPVDKAELALLQNAIGKRPVFLAASTHPGEDEIVLKAHKAASARIANLLTIIVPRHPERGAAIEQIAVGMGLKATRRETRGEPRGSIYIADTIGELGLFYTAAPVAFIGGSLVEHGGQNPVEAVKLGAAVLTGPHWFNFKDAYKTLQQCGGCRVVDDADELARAIIELCSNPALADAMRERAERGVAALGGAMQRTMDALEPYLPPLEHEPLQLPGPMTYAS
ncbi:MAG: glycosyltransferase N-terminal domain-containing protein [Hyphomicrobiales bacterium]|nr:glycosyltransferase N-terminal domain-containing protein [Hyphomicrobiales bacterium]